MCTHSKWQNVYGLTNVQKNSFFFVHWSLLRAVPEVIPTSDVLKLLELHSYAMLE